MTGTELKKITKASNSAKEEALALVAEKEQKQEALASELADVSARLAKAEEAVKTAEKGSFEDYKTACKNRDEVASEKRFYEAQTEALDNNPYITAEKAETLKNAMAAGINADAESFREAVLMKLREMVVILHPMKEEADELRKVMLLLDELSGSAPNAVRYDAQIVTLWNWFYNSVFNTAVLGRDASKAKTDQFISDALKK